MIRENPLLTVLILKVADVQIWVVATYDWRIATRKSVVVSDSKEWARITGGNTAPEVAEIPAIFSQEGQLVTVSVDFTDADLEDIHTATVDWGDGITGSATISRLDDQRTILAEHVYADNGSYPFPLNLTDGVNDSVQLETTASVENVAPTLLANVDYQPSGLDKLGEQVATVISGTFTDPGFNRLEAGTVETFIVSLDWGDGTVEDVTADVVQGSDTAKTTGSFSASHVYARGGVFTATATVTDDDDATDEVFVYDTAGDYLGQWQLDPANADPSGITNDPTGGTQLWVVDRVDGLVYRYDSATKLLGGSQVAADTFVLAAGNLSPEGIADPPPVGDAREAISFSQGDANLDGVVDLSDFNIWNVNKFTQDTSGLTGDFNADGNTDLSDFNIWNAHKFTQVVFPIPQSPQGDSLLDDNGQVIFTTSDDFLHGELFNVNVTDVPDEVRLDPQGDLGTFPFIWIANSGEGTVSRFDTRTGEELGRYRTGANSGTNPSRVVVTANGDVWVANRGDNSSIPFNAVKILREDFIDRNGNGVVDTAHDLNGDGYITGNEVLPWDANGDGQPDDERIAMTIHAGRNQSDPSQWNYGGGARGIAVDTHGKLWVGLLSRRQYEVFDADTGQFEGIVPVNGRPYGAVIGQDGILYSTSSGSRYLDRIDTNSQTYLGTVDLKSSMYGITLDKDGVVWCSGYPAGNLIRYDPVTGDVNHYRSADGGGSGGGVAVDRNGNVWAANHDGTFLYKWVFNDDGTVHATTVETGGRDLKSASIDADGYVYDTQAVDPDADPLRFTILDGPDGMGIDPETGMIDWMPDQADVKTHPVTVQVSDGRGGFDTQSYVIDVTVPGNGEVHGTKFHDSNGDGQRELITFLGPLPYLSSADSPFDLTGLETAFWLEDFEDGELNTPGVIATSDRPMAVIGNLPTVDSVDGDDGQIDGLGNAGHNLYPAGGQGGISIVGVTFTFDESVLGNFPTHAGIVWTDGPPNDTVVLEAFGPNGEQIGSISAGHIGDDTDRGTTAEDRFFGVVSPYGISAIRIHGTGGGYAFDVDHLQYGFTPEAEPGLEGWTIYLDQNQNARRDPGERWTLTDENGDYAFDGLPAGTYHVREELLAGWQQVAPDDGLYEVVITADETATGIDFGNSQVSGDNNAPLIVNQPLKNIDVGELYRHDVDAVDPDSDPLTYELPVAPDGMTVHPDLGVVVWQPTSDQVGQNQVVLKVSDGRGGVDIQSFMIDVLPPNTAPVITTDSLPEQIQADGPFEMLIMAQDAEADPITFSIESTVSGDNRPDIHPDTGRLSWTPTLQQIGTYEITITAIDQPGAAASQTYAVEVVQTLPNDAPVIDSQPRTRTRIDMPYIYLVEASDPNGDRLSYDLEPGAPSDMTLSTDGGLLQWNPTADDLGPNGVTIRVSDGRGGEATQTFTLDVLTDAQNTAPRITSNPPLSTILSKTYQYPAEAFDADGDLVTWRLDEAPRGMSINAITGEIFWTPETEQQGDSHVVLRTTDAFGAWATQSFDVSVRGVNRPPAILSTPETEGFVEEAYIYAVRAEDPDGDAFTFSFAGDIRPEGMEIDPGSGLIERTPEETGSQAVSVMVRDALGGIDIQVFSVRVTDVNLNLPPVITSTPRYTVTAQHDYAYAVTATDPENDPLLFSLEGQDLPDGISIGETTGLIGWTSVANQVGEYAITVVATDSADDRATQSFTLSVRANRAPTITSQPVTEAAAGVGYGYDVWANDPDGDPVEIHLNRAPEGMTIDEHGRIRWLPDLALMGTTAEVSIIATDNYGGSSVPQSFTVSVEEDTTPPKVVLTASTNRIDPGGNVRFEVRATDEAGIDTVVLLVDGISHAVNQDGTVYVANLTFDEPGRIEVVAQATDLAGNPGTSDALEVHVLDPNDNTYPVITFDALIPQVFDDALEQLVDGERIEGDALYRSPVLTYLTDIELSITDDNMGAWYIEYAPTHAVNTADAAANDPDYVLLAEGSGVIDHQRFRIDPTVLANDAYALRVRAYDGNQGWAELLAFGVSGNAKLGNFAFTVTDFSISLAGIPIVVNRTYDTLAANREGDFGYGWTMSISDANIAETTRPDMEMQSGDRVYLTNPEGQRVGFTYAPTYQSAWVFGAIANPVFTADPGVRDTLTVKEGSYGVGGVIGALGGVWNPSQYVLTTRDGTVYEYIQRDQRSSNSSQPGGLQRITDVNGTFVTFTDTAITHSIAGQIDLIRDARGRIKQIVDTAGNSIKYAYDAAGNLATFMNQLDDPTTYTYHPERAHFLEEIHDADGVRIFKADFDDDGRLAATTDALGNVVQQEFNPGAMNGTITDARGNVTTLWYDESGNVTLEESEPVVNPITGQTTQYSKEYQYTDSNHPDKETKIVDYDGTVTDYKYDTAGNTTRVVRTSADGSQSTATRFDYDASDNLKSITVPGNTTSTFVYNGKGEVTSIITAAAEAATATYNDQGKQTSFTDFNGNKTTYDYEEFCSCGTPAKTIHPGDSYELRQWNGYTDITSVEYYDAADNLIHATKTDYDNLRRKTRETTGVGENAVVVTYQYDGSTQNVTKETVVHPTDALQNRVTHYFYDRAGNLVRQVDPDLDVDDPTAGIFFKYDAGGNRVWLMDPVGNVTTWIYDALDRAIEERDPLYWDGTDWASMTDEEMLALIGTPTPVGSAPFDSSHITRYAYDGADNLIEQIDRNGRRRTFDYDYRGNMLSEVWYDQIDDTTILREMVFTYNTSGNMPTAVDPDAEYVFTYDAMNRLETMSVDYPWATNFDTFTLTYDYDSMGNVTSIKDNLGVEARSEYDQRHRLASRDWIGDSVDEARVDFLYTAIGQTKRIDRYSDLDATDLVAKTNYAWDTAGHPTQIRHADALDALFAQYDYEYDFSGLLTEELLDHRNDDYDRTADYGYDARGQLISALYDNDQTDETFSYDANGNRTLPGYVTGPGNQLRADGTFNYTYDAEGNMVTKTRVVAEDGEINFTEYEYDFRNRMTKVTQYSKDPSEGGIILHEESYRYDALGRRIQVVSDGDETIIVYGGGSFVANEWARFTAVGKVVERFLFTNRGDQLVARWTNGQGIAWPLSDHLGTIRDMTNNAGQFVQHVNYTAFGTPTFSIPVGNTHPHAFTGRVWDSIPGMSFHRARIYDPHNGRFVSVDPIGLDNGEYSFYSYSLGSPLHLADRTGYMAMLGYNLSSKPSETATPAVSCAGRATANVVAREVAWFVINEMISRGFQAGTGAPLPPNFDARDIQRLIEYIQGFEFDPCSRNISFVHGTRPGRNPGFRPNPSYPPGGFRPGRPPWRPGGGHSGHR